jgi:iron complex transport system ATP-binding protein
MVAATSQAGGVLVNSLLVIRFASVGYPERMVLEKVNLELVSGEVFAIVGPNGVGKSTLIKTASGILPIIRGSVEVEGKDIVNQSPEWRAQRIGIVPQATRVPPGFTARQVVLMGRTPYLGWLEREGQHDLELAERALVHTCTEHLADRYMGELSGGEQQRVMVARALAQTPKLLLLDEPTAHLDLRHQDETLAIIRRLADEQEMGVLIALHDLNLVARFADRVALLSDGTVKKQGLPREVLTPEDLAAAYGVKIHVMDHPLHGTPLVLSG